MPCFVLANSMAKSNAYARRLRRYAISWPRANNHIHLKSEQGFPPKQFLQLAFSVFQ